VRAGEPDGPDGRILGLVRRLALIVCMCLASSPVLAQEPVHLEHLGAARVGSASLVAGDDVRRAEDRDDGAEDRDDGAARDVYAALAGEITSGAQHLDGWQPPYLVGGTRFELGAFRKPGTTADVDSRIFLYAPDGAHDGVAASGRHRFLGNLHAWAGDWHANLALAVGLAHSNEGERGIRALEVAPAPYRRLTIAPTLWLTLTGDDDRFGFAFDYALDDRRYLEAGPVRGFRSHRAAVGFGFRDDKPSHVGSLRFLNLAYVHSAAETPFEGPAHTTHQLEIAALQGRGHFGQSSDRPDHYSRATVGMSLGWAFLTREVFSWAYQPPAGWLHSPQVFLDMAYEDDEIGRLGAAAGHRPGLSPDGLEALGITFGELEARLAPNDVPLGGSLAGTLARVEALPLGERDARYHARADLELFARVGIAEIGPRGTLGHGVANGSMGWSLYGAQSWFGNVGGFVRLVSR
jgi:hypothetical protein